MRAARELQPLLLPLLMRLQVAVTVMVERRMLAKPERAEQFQHYCRTTSAWVPWFKGAAAAAEEEEQKEE